VNIFAPWLPPRTKMLIELSSLFSFEEYFNPETNEILSARENAFSYKFTAPIAKFPDDEINFHKLADYVNFEYDTTGMENGLEDRSEALLKSKVTTNRNVIKEFDNSLFMSRGWQEEAFREEFYLENNQTGSDEIPVLMESPRALSTDGFS